MSAFPVVVQLPFFSSNGEENIIEMLESFSLLGS